MSANDIVFSDIPFANYQDALASCDNAGYSHEDLVKVVARKNDLFKSAIFAKNRVELDLGLARTLIGVSCARQSSRMHVLDFGGGGGHHYTIANYFMGSSLQLRWSVVETSAMCMASHSAENANLTFFDNIEGAKKHLGYVDLVYASSSLQYCPDPVAYLEDLINVNARYIFITRTMLSELDYKIFSIQHSQLSCNGPGVLPPEFEDKLISYPITYIPRIWIEDLLMEKYTIKFCFEESKGGLYSGNKAINNMYGYFCELK